MVGSGARTKIPFPQQNSQKAKSQIPSTQRAGDELRSLSSLLLSLYINNKATMVNPITAWIKSGMESNADAEASFEDRVAE